MYLRFFAKETNDPLHYAFDKKITVHPMAKGEPIPAHKAQEIWKGIMEKEGGYGKRAAYFHIPFCETHCLYCGFYQNAYRPEEAEKYVNYLIRELEMMANCPFIRAHPFHAIYLGGGTPTALPASDIFRILKTIRDILPLANDCEITLEGRIYNFGDEKIFASIEGGVNRISIGVQSFDTFVRRRVGRIEEKEGIIERLKFINSLDQAAVIIDLIYGLPYQTKEIWESDVRQYIELGLDGVDLYQLNIYKGGRLEQAVKNKKIEKPADIPTQADMFAKGVEIMKRARYIRLSQSHWARSTRERNIYNSLVRKDSICIPFGSGAAGWLSGYFFYQENRLSNYYQMIDAGEKPIIMGMKRHPYHGLFKNIEEGLESGTLDLELLGQRYNLDLRHIFSPLFKQWEEVGLIRIKDGLCELTLAGEFWYVNLCQLMIDYFQEISKKGLE